MESDPQYDFSKFNLTSGLPKADVEAWEKRVADVSDAINEILNTDVKELDRRREQREEKRRKEESEKRRAVVSNMHKRRYNLDYSRFNDDALVDKIECQIDEAQHTASTAPLAATAMSSFSKTEKLLYEEAEAAKKRGNDAFQKGDFEAAYELYDRGIALSPPDLTLLLTITNNRAMAALKTGRFKQCIADATEVLSHDPKNLKALQRRAAAQLECHCPSEAIQDLEVAKRLSTESSNVTIDTMLSRAVMEFNDAKKEDVIDDDVKVRLDAATEGLSTAIRRYTEVRKVVVSSDGSRTMQTDEEIEKADQKLVEALTSVAKLHLDADADGIEVRIRRSGVIRNVLELYRDVFSASEVNLSSWKHTEVAVLMSLLMLLSTALKNPISLHHVQDLVEAVLPSVLRWTSGHASVGAVAVRLVTTLCKSEHFISVLSKAFPGPSVVGVMKRCPPRVACDLAEALLASRNAAWANDVPAACLPVAINLLTTSNESVATRDAISCLLQLSYYVDMPDTMITSLSRAASTYPHDGVIVEGVLSVSYNVIVKTKDETRRAELLRTLQSEGIGKVCSDLLAKESNGDAALQERAIMLISKMVVLPEIQSTVFPNVDVAWSSLERFVKHSNANIQEHAVTLLARLVTKCNLSGDLKILHDSVALLGLVKSKNVRTIGNGALLVSHLAAQDVEGIATRCPGLVEALLDAIKYCRSSAFKSTTDRSKAMKDGILHESDIAAATTSYSEAELGSAQRNAAVALARLARVPGCRATLQALQGFEILHTVSKSTPEQ
eukprot:PhM_4_TR18608/c0_g1_i1/m.30949